MTVPRSRTRPGSSGMVATAFGEVRGEVLRPGPHPPHPRPRLLRHHAHGPLAGGHERLGYRRHRLGLGLAAPRTPAPVFTVRRDRGHTPGPGSDLVRTSAHCEPGTRRSQRWVSRESFIVSQSQAEFSPLSPAIGGTWPKPSNPQPRMQSPPTTRKHRVTQIGGTMRSGKPSRRCEPRLLLQAPMTRVLSGPRPANRIRSRLASPRRRRTGPARCSITMIATVSALARYHALSYAFASLTLYIRRSARLKGSILLRSRSRLMVIL